MKSPHEEIPSIANYDHANEQNILALYLADVGKFPLLTREQEVELAGRVKAGDQEARNLMINSNLRLVVKIAHNYANYALPLADLISEGNIGLMKAVERFDPEKGGKLSTYASWWIKQRIKRALANQSRTIRIPVHLSDQMKKIRRASAKVHERTGREATAEEIAEEVDLPVSRVAHLKSVSVQPTSLSSPVGEEENSTLGDLIGDENSPTPAEKLTDKSLQEDVEDSISELGDREAEVVRLRYGLNGRSPLTLREIGAEFGVSRERVRQLQNLALIQMRRAMSERDRQVGSEELEAEAREMKKMEVLREFLHARTEESDGKLTA